jgi:hypothetical protein
MIAISLIHGLFSWEMHTNAAWGSLPTRGITGFWIVYKKVFKDIIKKILKNRVWGPCCIRVEFESESVGAASSFECTLTFALSDLNLVRILYIFLTNLAYDSH